MLPKLTIQTSSLAALSSLAPPPTPPTPPTEEVYVGTAFNAFKAIEVRGPNDSIVSIPRLDLSGSNITKAKLTALPKSPFSVDGISNDAVSATNNITNNVSININTENNDCNVTTQNKAILALLGLAILAYNSTGISLALKEDDSQSDIGKSMVIAEGALVFLMLAIICCVRCSGYEVDS